MIFQNSKPPTQTTSPQQTEYLGLGLGFRTAFIRQAPVLRIFP